MFWTRLSRLVAKEITLGKSVALECDIPLILVVTNYSGSEMLAASGLVDDGRKVQHYSPRILPKVLIYDPGHTVGLLASMR